MNKSLEAFIRGYLFFRVNGNHYWLYNSALAARKIETGEVIFTGWHILFGWTCFYWRFKP